MRAQVTDWTEPDYGGVYAERVQRLRGMRGDPEAIGAHREFYRTHPVEFIEDFAVTYDPRRIPRGLKPTIPFILMPKQRALIEWLHAHYLRREPGVIEKSRDTGISWCMAAFGVWLWLFEPEAAVGFGSYSQDKVDELGVPDSILEKCRIIIRNLPAELRPIGFQDTDLMHGRLINAETGATITGDVGDKIGRGGRAALYFVDEAAHLAHQELADASLAATADCIIYASTPLGTGAFYRKVKSGEYDVFRYHWSDDPRKTKEWAAKKRRQVGPVIWAQEFDIDHTASIENVVVEAAWVQSSRLLAEMLREKHPPEQWAPIAGLDVATGHGKANTVLLVRRGPWVLMPETWKHSNPTQTARQAIRLCQEWGVARLNFDSVGVGEGVTATLLDEGALFIDQPNPVVPEGRPITIEQQINAAARVQRGAREELVTPEPLRVPFAVQGVNAGVPASAFTVWGDGKTSKEKFANVKAEIWWMMRDRFQATHEHYLALTGQDGGRLHEIENLILLPDHEPLAGELPAPTYYLKAGSKIAIEDKDKLKRRGVASPDHAEALSMTFAPEEPSAEVGKVSGYF